jgi:hypothetical protein
MYKLIHSVFTQEGPIRSATIGPSGEIVTGFQSDAPCFKRWKISGDNIEEVGTAVFHDHWVTALTSLHPQSSRSFYPQVFLPLF